MINCSVMNIFIISNLKTYINQNTCKLVTGVAYTHDNVFISGKSSGFVMVELEKLLKF